MANKVFKDARSALDGLLRDNLMLMCGGFGLVGVPDKLIADQLGVSPRTLEGHWRAIHHKLGSVNRCQAGFIFAALRENPQGKVPA